MWRIYKEGQGKWARGILVAVVMLGAVFALSQLHGYLPLNEQWAVFGIDWRFVIHGPMLIAAAWLSLWLFNRPSTADFLIDTEGELKNKVTWPSKKEEINASIVVIVTVMILSVFIFGVDNLLKLLTEMEYGLYPMKKD
jgi:preprotein translocase subunit SecE